MTVALALLLACAAAGWLAPPLLRRLSDPVVALVGWLTSIVAVVATSAVAVVLLLLPEHGLSTLHHCWESVVHGTTPTVEVLGGITGGALLTGLLVRVAVVGARGARRRARAREEQLSVLRLAGRREAGAPPTVWLDHERPLAFSLASKPGVVVATEGLHLHLTPSEVDAVLDHERAHLNGHHHLLVAAADAVATALPVLPLFKRAGGTIRELVEMSADMTAARTHGADTVRTALLRVSCHGAPDSALAMGRDAIDARLERLRRRPRTPSRVSRVLSGTLTGLTAVALPLATASTTMFTLMLLTC
ncbi:M56 family metallopeptidase [Lentzea jiangxiensis]|uniref:Peptidase family M48 n=1 Tax=Lentzea jiangxiensis TaxID=641025 RepID=A0A1H0KR21_9PSEU|nr:M56 family metallopeptidase [Lentzea jiangxiensis]SDO58424.1 Peptidase family M48 [Lentzea jiangxiensis]